MDLDDFGNDYSYIESKSTGEKLWLREREGVYVLDMMVAPPTTTARPPPDLAKESSAPPNSPGFIGPGR